MSVDIQAGEAEARRAAKECGKQRQTLISDATLQLKIGGDGKPAPDPAKKPGAVSLSARTWSKEP